MDEITNHIPMEGTPNFRDLAGIAVAAGRQVRGGIIFRSGAIDRLTPADLERFAALNIKTVIDLRTPYEIKRAPDRYPDTGVRHIPSTIGNPADMEEALATTSAAKLTIDMVDMFMGKAYADFIGNLDHFRPLFDTMLNGNATPFLFHCSAGKDRTGIAAALVLLALGAGRDAIMEDYLLSNKYNEPFFRENLRQMGDFGFAPDVIKELSFVKPEYLQLFFDTLDKRFGRVETMLEQVFGITGTIRRRLIDQYTG